MVPAPVVVKFLVLLVVEVSAEVLISNESELSTDKVAPVSTGSIENLSSASQVHFLTGPKAFSFSSNPLEYLSGQSKVMIAKLLNDSTKVR